MRRVGLVAGLCVVALFTIGIAGVATADEPQATGAPAPTGATGQMGPALRPAQGAGGTAPTTPEELQRRQDQLNRVNRSPGRPPQQPDAPVTPPRPGSQSPSPQQPVRAAQCQVFPTFASLVEVLPLVGDCIQDAFINPSSGDIEQLTTGGLLVERAADNTLAFTDGQQTWVLGADGLVAASVDNV